MVIEQWLLLDFSASPPPNGVTVVLPRRIAYEESTSRISWSRPGRMCQRPHYAFPCNPLPLRPVRLRFARCTVYCMVWNVACRYNCDLFVCFGSRFFSIATPKSWASSVPSSCKCYRSRIPERGPQTKPLMQSIARLIVRVNSVWKFTATNERTSRIYFVLRDTWRSLWPLYSDSLST